MTRTGGAWRENPSRGQKEDEQGAGGAHIAIVPRRRRSGLPSTSFTTSVWSSPFRNGSAAASTGSTFAKLSE